MDRIAAVVGGFMTDTTVWTVVGGVSSATAAVAALVALFYARATVRQGTRARTDADKAHAEAISEMRAAQDAAATAHAEQMAERRRALEAEIELRRIEQVERVAEVLADIAEVAQQEAITGPGRSADGGAVSVLPTMLKRLEVALTALDALGGPDLDGVRGVVRSGWRPGGAESLMHAARNCLYDLTTALPSQRVSPDASGE